jgi:superfamily II DNA/RNA helicase
VANITRLAPSFTVSLSVRVVPPVADAFVVPCAYVSAMPARSPVAHVPKPRTIDCLSRALKDAFQELKFSKLTDVQESAIPSILSGKSTVIAAGTGTGKTLAYLAPICQQLKRAEVEEHQATRPHRPRAVILVPTRELALQVLATCKALCHVVKLRSVCITGGTSQALQRKELGTAIDILIATPGRLALMHEQGHVHFTDARHVVVDEADTMVDDHAGFAEELQSMLKLVLPKSTPAEGTSFSERKGAHTQFILVGATTSASLHHTAKSLFGTSEVISTNSVHKLPPKLSQEFINVTQEPAAKHAALLDVMARLDKSASKKVLVFCNTVPSARSTAHFLSESGYSNASLHGDIPPIMRGKEFAAFGRGEAQVLVCTDAAARGLDFPGVQFVVNFDFPRSEVDYLHRVGRVARAGLTGSAFNFVTKWDAAAARSIQTASAQLQSVIPSDGPIIPPRAAAASPSPSSYRNGTKHSYRGSNASNSGADWRARTVTSRAKHPGGASGRKWRPAAARTSESPISRSSSEARAPGAPSRHAGRGLSSFSTASISNRRSRTVTGRPPRRDSTK